jgi:hypothetical protein
MKKVAKSGVKKEEDDSAKEKKKLMERGIARRMSNMGGVDLGNVGGVTPDTMQNLLGWKPKRVIAERERQEAKKVQHPLILRAFEDTGLKNQKKSAGKYDQNSSLRAALVEANENIAILEPKIIEANSEIRNINQEITRTSKYLSFIMHVLLYPSHL